MTMTRKERNTAIDIIMEGVSKLEEQNKANYRRGLLTADEERKATKEVYQAMKELIKLMIMEVAA